MSQRAVGAGRVTGQVAEMYGRSDAEIKFLAGAAVAASGIVAALRTLRALDDLGLLPSSQRTTSVHGARPARIHRAA